ncbi:MAG: DUF1592 domain-containing protein [Planctomycetota bacterium]
MDLNLVHRAVRTLPALVVMLSVSSAWGEAKPTGYQVSQADRQRIDQLADLLDIHCVQCHGPDKGQGGIDLSLMLREQPMVRNRLDWVNVLQRISDGDMPPRRHPQPTAEERRALAGLIDRLVMRFDYAEVATAGYEPVRRLTHREYSNTLRDLLGIDWDAAEMFPTEMVGESGFDNSANTLFLQSGMMQRYLSAAERAIELALPGGASRQQWERVIGKRAAAMRAGERQAEAAFDDFLPRAFRRAVTDKEATNALAHYRSAVQRGKPHDRALRAALKNTLIEAPFLLRMEAVPDRVPKPGSVEKIGPYALASRLSYFLWASMPDDELMRLAAEQNPAKRLDHPAVLRAQVDRMLKDPKSLTLGKNFASQWLGFTHLGSRRRPDPIDMPEFTDSLMHAMRMESAHVFHDIVKHDRPLMQIIDSDFTFVNEELARFYGWRGIKGEHMRRIKLPNDRRGGFLTQASILMVTAFPDRTSPVVRGNWILSELLGTPPPPPPPDVGEFDERLEEAGLSPQRMMQLHSQKPSCANCHSRIDPLGFALENYDQFGRWRTRLEDGPRIRASGKLPEGVAFDGPDAFKDALLKTRLDDMNRQISRKMLSYALGRQLGYTDEHAVRTIAKNVKADGYKAKSLVYSIVQSEPFLYQAVPSKGVSE